MSNIRVNLNKAIKHRHKHQKKILVPRCTHLFRRESSRDPPILVLSMPTSKALTRFSKNMRTSRKLSRPILQEPSTRIMMSATASVWHTNWSTTRRKEDRITWDKQTEKCTYRWMKRHIQFVCFLLMMCRFHSQNSENTIKANAESAGFRVSLLNKKECWKITLNNVNTHRAFALILIKTCMWTLFSCRLESLLQNLSQDLPLCPLLEISLT